MDKKQKNDEKTYYGGQAVIEGVMMRGKKTYAMAVRKTDNEIELVKNDINPASDKYKFLKLPIIRGIVSFVDSLVTGTRLIMRSAEIAGLDDPVDDNEMSGFDKFLSNKLGDKLNDVLIYSSVAVALVISVALFMLLPVYLGGLFRPLLGGAPWAFGIIEGLIRIGIFLCYIYIVSLSKDIKRVFQYHGAEHKTINCYESGQELTVENVRLHTRMHKRCGTSFLLIVMLISMLFFIFVRTDTVWLRFAFRIIFVPFIAGVSYEVIKWAGRSDNLLVSIVSFPGIRLQKITTAEPDDSQIEIAITALKGVLESEPS